MTWWKDNPMSEAAANAAWQLVVELRTGFPEIRSAQMAGDMAKLSRCLDRLATKATKVSPWLADGWPSLAAEIGSSVEVLKVDPDHPTAWQGLADIADELEEAIGTGAAWWTRSD